jgi:hypothetical protein
LPSPTMAQPSSVEQCTRNWCFWPVTGRISSSDTPNSFVASCSVR